MSRDFDNKFVLMIAETFDQSKKHWSFGSAPLAEIIETILEARAQVISKLEDDLEYLKDVYSFDIPDEILLNWLVAIAWAKSYEDDHAPITDLVQFHATPPDTEDSYFQVLDNDGDLKDSLADAIKKAYFRLRADEKEQRRKEYEKLKKEFEPQ